MAKKVIESTTVIEKTDRGTTVTEYNLTAAAARGLTTNGVQIKLGEQRTDSKDKTNG